MDHPDHHPAGVLRRQRKQLLQFLRQFLQFLQLQLQQQLRLQLRELLHLLREQQQRLLLLLTPTYSAEGFPSAEYEPAAPLQSRCRCLAISFSVEHGVLLHPMFPVQISDRHLSGTAIFLRGTKPPGGYLPPRVHCLLRHRRWNATPDSPQSHGHRDGNDGGNRRPAHGYLP